MSKPERASRSTYDRALDMLEARARSVADMRRLLVRKGEPESDVDAAIERLRGSGLLDDATFARQFTRSKALGAGLSRRRLQQELAKRGVAPDVAGAAIERVFDEERIDDDASIERVAKKKLRTLAKLDLPVQHRRLFAFLVRRGYESEDIGRIIRELIGEDTIDG